MSVCKCLWFDAGFSISSPSRDQTSCHVDNAQDDGVRVQPSTEGVCNCHLVSNQLAATRVWKIQNHQTQE